MTKGKWTEQNEIKNVVIGKIAKKQKSKKANNKKGNFRRLCKGILRLNDQIYFKFDLS